MESLVYEEQSLPIDFEKSANPGHLQEVTQLACHDVTSPMLALPGGPVGNKQLSPQRVRTMKEYDQQLSDLRKENFSLKLRIYFLEERMQSAGGGRQGPEDPSKVNIELKVEVESLKQELAEKQDLLVKASNALDSLEMQHKTEITQLRQQQEASRRATDKRIRDLERELELLHDREQRRRRRSSDQIPPEVLAQALQQLEDPSKGEMVELSQQVQELEDIITRLNQDLTESQSKAQDLEDALQEKEKQLKGHEENTMKRDKTIQGLLETVYTRSQEISRLKERMEQRDVEIKGLKEELNSAYRASKSGRSGESNGEMQESRQEPAQVVHISPSVNKYQKLITSNKIGRSPKW